MAKRRNSTDTDRRDLIRAAMNKVVSALTPREKKVLRLRFGIAVDPDHKLERVGEEFEQTRERILQIEAMALRKGARNAH